MNYYNLLDKTYLSNTLKVIKNLKSNLILITNDYIVGVNDDYTILSVMDNYMIESEGRKLVEVLYPICFKLNDLVNLCKYAEVNNFDLFGNGETVISNDKIVDISMPFHKQAIMDLYSKMSYVAINKPILNIKDLRNYFALNNINYFETKSDNKLNIKLNRHLITILHGNLLPVNKSDNIELFIYPYNKDSCLYRYSIYKSKIKHNIDVYMCCLNLD